MGHQHLGTLPSSRKWRDVIALIGDGASVQSIASATSSAAELQMTDGSNDPAVQRAFWLLTQIPLAARKESFGEELRKLGMDVVDRPTLVGIAMAMSQAVDQYVDRTGGRTDLGEMAQLAAVESLNAIAGRELDDLFAADSLKARRALAGLATVKQFAVLARDFFSRLSRHQLSYFLSRELSNHVSETARFNTIRAHHDFEIALDLHCRETSRIIKEFSGEWFSKKNFEGGIDQEAAGRFVHVAFKKLREELKRRGKHD